MTMPATTWMPAGSGRLRSSAGAEVVAVSRKGEGWWHRCEGCGETSPPGLRAYVPAELAQFNTFLAEHAACAPAPRSTR